MALFSGKDPCCRVANSPWRTRWSTWAPDPGFFGRASYCCAG